MLNAGPLRDEHGNGESHRAANAVAKPDRAEGGVLGRQALGRLQRPSRRRLGDVGLIQLGGLSTRCQQRIAARLPGGIGRRPDPERRLKHLHKLLVAGIGGKLEQPSHLRLGDRLAGRVEPREVRPLNATIKAIGAGQQHGRDRGHRLGVLLLVARGQSRRRHGRPEE
jgi:hypothetical protein